MKKLRIWYIFFIGTYLWQFRHFAIYSVLSNENRKYKFKNVRRGAYEGGLLDFECDIVMLVKKEIDKTEQMFYSKHIRTFVPYKRRYYHGKR